LSRADDDYKIARALWSTAKIATARETMAHASSLWTGILDSLRTGAVVYRRANSSSAVRLKIYSMEHSSSEMTAKSCAISTSTTIWKKKIL
jgi:hypothetical protein